VKEKHKAIALGILVAVAAVVWLYVWKGHSQLEATQQSLQSLRLLAVENPSIHWAELERAQKTEYKSNGRNPFSTIAPPTAQEVKAKEEAQKAQAAAAAAAPPVPVQPVITTASLPPNMKYFGYGTVPAGSPRRAFFTDGDDVYIVPEGETLLGRFRILKVGNTNLEFQEISSGLRGTAILEEPLAATPNA
jgi:hypothetical protein